MMFRDRLDHSSLCLLGVEEHANQLLTHKLRPDEPFEAVNGGDSVTIRLQYAGPLKFGQFCELHQVQLPVILHQDVFIIDYEGFYSLGEITDALKQATFALSQIAGMTVLLMKDQVNFQNIENIGS
jgi:hypothetical protein